MAFLEEKNKSAPVDVKADPFTLPHLIAWLRTRDPSETYAVGSVTDCLVCRYGWAHGEKGEYGMNFAQAFARFGEPAADALNNIAHLFPTTMGAALSRAIAIREGK